MLMENAETRTSTPVESGSLQAQVEALQHMVVSILILLVVVSGTLSVYLLRQMRLSGKDLDAVRPGATQLIESYTKDAGPRIDAFLERLKDYSRTHPDIVPILARYGLNAPSPAVPAPPAQKK